MTICATCKSLVHECNCTTRTAATKRGVAARSVDLHRVARLRERRPIMLNADEVSEIRYALCELAGRRAEQAIDYGNPSLRQDASNLRALAERVVSESQAA